MAHRCPPALALAAALAASGLAPLAAQVESVIMDRFGFELVSQAPFLEDAKAPRRYAPENLLDGKASTSWAIGNGGPGTVIYLGLPRDARRMRVVNGYASSADLFAKNNRPRRIKVELCAGFSFPGRVTELGWVFDIDRTGGPRILTLGDTMSAQALDLGIDWDRADDIFRESRARFDARLPEAGDYEREAYAKGLVLERLLRIEILDVHKGSKWNDTCISELSFEPETRSVAGKEGLVGIWTTSRGADYEELELQEDGSLFSYSGGRPWGGGTWRIEEGCLKFAWEGGCDEAIYSSFILEGRILTLIGTAGNVEVYEGEASGAP